MIVEEQKSILLFVLRHYELKNISISKLVLWNCRGGGHFASKRYISPSNVFLTSLRRQQLLNHEYPALFTPDLQFNA